MIPVWCVDSWVFLLKVYLSYSTCSIAGLKNSPLINNQHAYPPNINNKKQLLAISCRQYNIRISNCSLAKEHPWVEHLTSLSKRGWCFLSVSTFNNKEHPCHIYSNSLQIIRQTVHTMEPPVASKSRPDCTTTL